MKAKELIGRSAVLVLMMAWGIWGCAGQPFDPPQTDEIPKGPGVFTKDEGSVILYDSDQKKTQPSPENTSRTPSTAAHPSSSTPDFEAFEAYQQWLQWKTTAVENGEWEEFQQWREWKKYKDWKNSK